MQCRQRMLLCCGSALLATACHEAPTVSDPDKLGIDPVASKGGPDRVDSDSRVAIVWAADPHGLSPGVEGDGRARDGGTSGTLNEYQGAFCGVYAKLYSGPGESGDLNADFDALVTSESLSTCGPPRSLLFHLGGSLGDVRFGPHFVVHDLTHFAPGESRLQVVGFGIQQPNCQRVRFDSQYPGASDARVSRLDDASTTVRRWRVESQGAHTARCTLLDKRGNLYPVGDPIVLPFSYTVTEVPYPYPRFP